MKQGLTISVTTAIILASACAAFYPTAAVAGGLLGDIVRAIPGGKAAGDALDETSRRVKEAVPPYKVIEEGGSSVVRKTVEELKGETAGPTLAAWITASKGNVINAGVGPIPQQIREALTGFFPEDVLNSVRYRSGWGNEVALPALSFRFGDAAAVTLDDIVMFRNEQDAQYNPELWAHELGHVLQYRKWGILDFAKRYVKDHEAVEREAEDLATRFAVWRHNQLAAGGQQPFQQSINTLPQSSNICRTPMGACQINGFGPIGIQCWCGSYNGPIFGSLSP